MAEQHTSINANYNMDSEQGYKFPSTPLGSTSVWYYTALGRGGWEITCLSVEAATIQLSDKFTYFNL